MPQSRCARRVLLVCVKDQEETLIYQPKLSTEWDPAQDRPLVALCEGATGTFKCSLTVEGPGSRHVRDLRTGQRRVGRRWEGGTNALATKLQ